MKSAVQGLAVKGNRLGATRRAVSVALSLVVVLVLGTVPAAGATSSPGDELWAKRYNGPAGGDDSARALGVSPDGSRVFVTGTSYGRTSATLALSASTGGQLWKSISDDPVSNVHTPVALGVSPDGARVFVTGHSSEWESGGDFDYGTIAYDASTGKQLWVTLYNGPANGFDFAEALGVSPDGSKVFVTGYSRGPTNFHYATVAYDASSGVRLWVKRYNGLAPGDDFAHALGVSPDGSRVFVTGNSHRSGRDVGYATVAYDSSTGAELWVRKYNGPHKSFDSASSLAQTADGSTVFVTGSSHRSKSSSDYYVTLAYEASTGARLWMERQEAPAKSYGHPAYVGVSPDASRVFVTGTSLGPTSNDDYVTFAYKASNGARLWARRYNGPANSWEYAVGLGVSPDGSKVFVTGQSPGPTSDYDYDTVAYDASTGQALWVSRYNGPANWYDSPSDLAVSPDGSKVFVTGQAFGTARGVDFATVAYSTT